MRFPRDWVGPLDELLPIGPMPRRPAGASLQDANTLPPSADAFWSEDSAALHDAVSSPEGAPTQWSTPADADDADVETGLEARSDQTASATGRPPRRLARTRMLAGAAVLAVTALLAAAVIGYSESGSHRVAGQASVGATASNQPAVTEAAVHPAPRPAASAKHQRRPAVSRTRARTRAGTHHRARRTHHSAPHPRAAPTATTPATTSTPSTTSSTSAGGASPSGTVSGSGPTTVNSHPVSSPPPAQPAFGQQGTLGPGSSSDS